MAATWEEKVIVATAGMQLGPLIRTALGHPEPGPPVHASVTSFGWIIASFTDLSGVYVTDARIGITTEFRGLLRGIAAVCQLSWKERRALIATVFKSFAPMSAAAESDLLRRIRGSVP